LALPVPVFLADGAVEFTLPLLPFAADAADEFPLAFAAAALDTEAPCGCAPLPFCVLAPLAFCVLAPDAFAPFAFPAGCCGGAAVDAAELLFPLLLAWLASAEALVCPCCGAGGGLAGAGGGTL
jgi:hypothetical protein